MSDNVQLTHQKMEKILRLFDEALPPFSGFERYTPVSILKEIGAFSDQDAQQFSFIIRRMREAVCLRQPLEADEQKQVEQLLAHVATWKKLNRITDPARPILRLGDKKHLRLAHAVADDILSGGRIHAGGRERGRDSLSLGGRFLVYGEKVASFNASLPVSSRGRGYLAISFPSFDKEGAQHQIGDMDLLADRVFKEVGIMGYLRNFVPELLLADMEYDGWGEEKVRLFGKFISACIEALSAQH
ncbi:hypothetical protein [Pannonibacter tanglangensis]|uniref:Uncharacterized protein n=1 Tax=Pannonibacter tanglangensis TaxID=2750084 RepID=A0ABW9ZFX0_9HYPH|nr:hypothetical protein [Pannonibacter sp. XCT-34]NBN63324.1 hypothetical protein [Pannonibacter sp. XCT-34]